MRFEPPCAREALALVARVEPRFRPVWDNRSPEAQAALARYFLPWRSQRTLLAPTRPRLLKWYCPFADQRQYYFGHRYCLNVYSGCSHRCRYCYAAAYEPAAPAAKRDFAKMLQRDLEDLDRFDVPPAPLHISNSTDPLQVALERRHGHCRLALAQILRYRHRFTTIVLLTKNAELAADYADILQELSALPGSHPAAPLLRGKPACVVELSLAFWREEVRAFWEPNAPSVAARVEGWQRLRAAGVAVALRLDPLFPRSPLIAPDNSRMTMADFGLPETQTLDDIANLVATAQANGTTRIIYSVAKLCRCRGQPLATAVRKLLACYRYLSGSEGVVWKSGSWRLPAHIAQELVVEPFLRICRERGREAKFCMKNLADTV